MITWCLCFLEICSAIPTTLHFQCFWIFHSFVLTDFSYLRLFRTVFSLSGHSLPLLYTDLCLLQPWSRAFFSVLRALRKCSCHDRDSPSMLDPPTMIKFLELHACSLRIKGRHALKWGTCSNSNTVHNSSTV